jgi:HD-like signal output (HDOD) protein
LQDAAKDARIRELVGQIDALPSVPAVYVELLEALKLSSTSFKSVADIVGRDVAMTARILQLVNSAFFGFYRNINSVEHAVGILGMRMIRSLVLSVKVFQEYSTEKMAAFPIDALMQHSVSTGALARIIAKSQSKDAVFADDCFMAGMLHDVGKLVLADKITDQYAKVRDIARDQTILFYDAESQELGVSHPEVGAYLMRAWGIADNVLEAVEYHHRPAECPNRTFGVLTVTHVANVMEHREGSGEGEGAPHEVDVKYLSALGMGDRLDKWSEICHVLARDER